MSASLRALLEGILDYAGLFPPAQLPLEPAFRNYLATATVPKAGCWAASSFKRQSCRNSASW